jgi:hypothetical protein
LGESWLKASPALPHPHQKKKKFVRYLKPPTARGNGAASYPELCRRLRLGRLPFQVNLGKKAYKTPYQWGKARCSAVCLASQQQKEV